MDQVSNSQEPEIILPGQNFRFVKELPLTDLDTNHRRLRLFANKGRKCSTCGIEGTRLVIGRANDGAHHVDLYDAHLTRMLTVGHIVPKSNGGKDQMFNFRPLCHVCNKEEGANFDHILNSEELFNQCCRGKQIMKRNKQTQQFQNGLWIVTINRIFRSDRDGKVYFGFNEGGFTYPATKVKFI